MRNLSGYATGRRLRNRIPTRLHALFAQPGGPMRNPAEGAIRVRYGTVPLRNRMALSTGLRSGLPGCATGQFKYCLVTQPDN